MQRLVLYLNIIHRYNHLKTITYLTFFSHPNAVNWLTLTRTQKVNTLHTAIGFTIHTKSFCFTKFSKFHEFLNQYQACLYLFKCIPYGDSKYSHQIPEFQHFWTFCDNFYCRLLMPAAWKGFKPSFDDTTNAQRLVLYLYITHRYYHWKTIKYHWETIKNICFILHPNTVS